MDEQGVEMQQYPEEGVPGWEGGDGQQEWEGAGEWDGAEEIGQEGGDWVDEGQAGADGEYLAQDGYAEEEPQYIDPTSQLPQGEGTTYFYGEGADGEAVPVDGDDLLETQYNRPPQQAAVRQTGEFNGNYDPPNPNDDFEPKKKKRKFRFGFWISSVAEEVGFSVWFRCYIYYLLLCHLMFVITYGTNMLMAAEYRMLLPPASPEFFGPMSMLLMFWGSMMLIVALIYMGVRLIVAWMGFSPKTCNLFLLPNRVTQSEKRAIRWRNYQLLLFELAVFVGPFVYGIMTTLSNGETFFTFIGNFTFAGFVVFECLMAVLFMYFWWVTACRKRSAMRMGKRMRKASKEDEHAQDQRAEQEDHYRNQYRNRHRYDDDHGSDSGEEFDEYDEHGNRLGTRRRNKGSESSTVAWHRKRMANPFVMSEFGMDVYSYQAYFVHVVLGIVWIVVASNSVMGGSQYILWFAILAVVLIGSLFMIWQGANNKNARKVARRQRAATIVSIIVWLIFIIVGIAGAAAGKMGVFAIMLFVVVFLTQGLALRRHDHHVRTEVDGGIMILPITEDGKIESERRRFFGRPSKFLPLIPCGNVWSLFCKRCVEVPIQDPDCQPLKGKGAYYLHCDRNGKALDGPLAHHAKKNLTEREKSIAKRYKVVPMEKAAIATFKERSGIYDKIVRPGEGFRFLMPGETNPFVEGSEKKLKREVYYNKHDRVLTSDAMLMTWFLILYILFTGILGNLGNSVSYELNGPAAGQTVAAYPTATKPAMVCYNRWGANEDFTIQDFAFLNLAGMHDDLSGISTSTDINAWFDGRLTLVEQSEISRQAGTVKNPMPPGVVLAYDKYTITGEDTDIFVLREPGYGRAWKRDVDVWSDAAMLQLLQALNPLFGLWPINLQKKFIKFTNFLKKPMENNEDQKELIDKITQANRKVYITGHGTHGGWAKLVVQELKVKSPSIQASAIAFGAPGVVLTAEKFSGSTVVIDEVNVVMDRGLMTRLDQQTGFVQQMPCDGQLSITGCQRFANIMCEILKSCGDGWGRVYTGFDSKAVCNL